MKNVYSILEYRSINRLLLVWITRWRCTQKRSPELNVVVFYELNMFYKHTLKNIIVKDKVKSIIIYY